MEQIETNKIIKEKCLQVPYCTCGKCIVKREKKDHFHSLPYSSNLSSIYQNDFSWKDPNNFKTDYLKAIHSDQENSFKKNINNCLISTAKLSYRPFKVNDNHINKKINNIESTPFYGSTTNENTYLNFGSSRVPKIVNNDDKDFKVAFRGKSSYCDYIFHPKEDYLRLNKCITYKPTLKFVGKLSNDTENKDNFKQVDFNQPAYFGRDKTRRDELNKNQMMPCPFPKSNFESVMKTSFDDHSKYKCKLREYLINKGITSLEI